MALLPLNHKEIEMKSNRYIEIAIVATMLALPMASWGQMSGHRMVLPNDLKWSDVPSLPTGAKIAVIEGPLNEAVPFTIRLKFPANYRLPAHWHPAVERVTVLSGTFYMGEDVPRIVEGLSRWWK